MISIFALFFAISGTCQTTGTGTGSSAGTQSSNNQQTITKSPHRKMHSTTSNSLQRNSRIHATNARNNGVDNISSETKSTPTSTSHLKISASKTKKNHTPAHSTKIHRMRTDSSGQ